MNKNNESTIYQSEWHKDMLAKLLKEKRVDRGLRQEDIAKKMGTFKSNVSRIEASIHSPTVGTLCKYIDALGLKFKVVVYE